jgi:two-component system sensor histidine kinase UhpB
MRRTTLLTQVLLVNLLLIAAAVVAAVVASSPDSQLRDTGAAGLVLGFAIAATVLVNVFLLSRRVEPLERLADEMERTDLSAPRPDAEPIGGAEEIQRLDRAFHEMLDRLEAERRRGSSAALEAQERERTRVARDLHDEVNQALTALVLRIEALRTQAPPELAAELAETGAVASQAMEELLALARQLRPTALDDLGLKAALAGLVEEVDRQENVTAVFESEETGGYLYELPDDFQLVTYRVAQEALSNAVRHSGAKHIRVRIMLNADGFELRVSDDGAGFDLNSIDGGLGLSGMRERALLVGAELSIDSRPGLGTRIRLLLADADSALERRAAPVPAPKPEKG